MTLLTWTAGFCRLLGWFGKGCKDDAETTLSKQMGCALQPNVLWMSGVQSIGHCQQHQSRLDRNPFNNTAIIMASLLADTAVPALKCPPGTRMHLLNLGILQADEGL